MKFVYLLRSLKDPIKTYIGLTKNVERRLKGHNEDRSPYTAKFSPWKVNAYFYFEDDAKAQAFEKYLKSGSGYEFAKKHLW